MTPSHWRVVRIGVWLYDGIAERGVWIIESDYDPWYELGKDDDQLEEGEQPTLNEDGLCFTAVFHEPVVGEPFWPGSSVALSIEEAEIVAQAMVPSSIAWKEGDHPGIVTTLR